MVQSGELGEIKPSARSTSRAGCGRGWRSDDQKQAAWRTDPKKSGAAGCFGDIGTHAYNLGRFITGLMPDQISCQLKIFEPGRALDDYGTAVDPLHQRRPRHGDRVADLARPRERPLDRESTARKARSNGIRKSRTR